MAWMQMLFLLHQCSIKPGFSVEDVEYLVGVASIAVVGDLIGDIQNVCQILSNFLHRMNNYSTILIPTCWMVILNIPSWTFY